MKLSIFSLLLAMAGSASAQFFGDVYFLEPSKQVAPSANFEMAVEIFTGAESFGALRFDVTFDPNAVEITGGDTVSGTSFFCVEGGLASFIVANDKKLDGPIGTVPVLTLRGRAIGANGTTSSLTLVPREFRATDGREIGQLNGFGGTITVNAGAAALPTLAVRQVVVSPLDPKIDPAIGVIAYRRTGCDVTVIHPTADGSFCATHSVIIDANQSIKEGKPVANDYVIQNTPLAQVAGRTGRANVPRPESIVTGNAVVTQETVSMYLLQQGHDQSLYRLERSDDLSSWEDTGLKTSGDFRNLIHIQETRAKSRFFRAVKVAE